MIFTNVVKQTEELVKENATTILTGVGVMGTVTTAVLTGRASFKAKEILDQFELVRLPNEDETGIVEAEPTAFDKVKQIWPLYIPPVASGGLTIGSIVMANRLSSRQVAALAAAYGLSERARHEYKEKVLEKLGVTKEGAIRDDVAQDRVTATSGSEVIITGEGNVLCFDMYTGRYFESTMESIKRAENRTNQEILNAGSASMSFFYDEIGLPATTLSDEMGWNVHTTGLVDLKFSTVMSKDQRPCIAIDFTNAPVHDYSRNY